MSSAPSFVVAIDGPAAAGKGTLSKSLSTHFGFDALDTGILYRAVGIQLLEAQISPTNAEEATRIAQALRPRDLERADLRDERVASAASQCSGVPGVRAALLAFQQEYAAHPPRGAGAILDGRDIGTAVCPNAQVKLWITASPMARAQRRHAEQPNGMSLQDIASAIAERDHRERIRAISPLVPAKDAILIDTTHLSPEAVFEMAQNAVQTALGQWAGLDEPAPRRASPARPR